MSCSEQRLCKGEYTYGWYSTSGRKNYNTCKDKTKEKLTQFDCGKQF